MRKTNPQKNPTPLFSGGVTYNRDIARNPKASYEEFTEQLRKVHYPINNPDNGYKLYGDYVKSPYLNPQEWLTKDYAPKQRAEIDGKYRNPNSVANLILFAAFGTMVWYLYSNGMLKIPGSDEEKKKEEPKAVATTVKPSIPSSGGVVSAVDDPIFPSFKTGEGVSYTDIKNAFQSIIDNYQSKGYNSWPFPQEEIDPSATISSIAQFQRDNWIPVGAIDPQILVNQYNHSVDLVNGLKSKIVVSKV